LAPQGIKVSSKVKAQHLCHAGVPTNISFLALVAVGEHRKEHNSPLEHFSVEGYACHGVILQNYKVIW